MKRIIGLICCILLTLTCFVGCGPEEDPWAGREQEIDVNLPLDVEATLKIGVESSKDEQEMIRKLADGFQKLYPKVTINIDPINGNLVSTLTGYYNAEKKNPGIMPDIFINKTLDLFTLSDKNILLDLDPYIAASTAAGKYAASDYADSVMKVGQLNYNGAQLMIPRSADRIVTHLNTKKLQAAGVDMSKIKNGWTWEDFLSVCEKLKTYYNGSPFLDGFLSYDSVYNPIFVSSGVSYFDASGKCTLDSAETKAALDKIKHLINSGYCAKFTSSAGANFQGGQGAMMFHSQAVQLQLDNFDKVTGLSRADYDLVTFPLIGSKPSIGAGSAGYSVFKGSQNKNVAWQFLLYMMSKEGQNILGGIVNQPPIRTDMTDPEDPTFRDNVWIKDYEDYNMEALIYRTDLNLATEYVAKSKKPSATNSINSAVQQLIVDYCNGETYETAMKTCLDSIEWALLDS